ncbi:MAG: DUF3489 domain-containing protein [Pseudomonadota bacterium]
MTRLTNTQSILLSQAAARRDGSLLPVPDSITATGAALTRSFTVLVKRGLAEKVMAQSDTACWREEEDRRIGLKITPAGLAAIAVEAAPDHLPVVADSGDADQGTQSKADREDAAAPCCRSAAMANASPRPKGKLGLVLEAVERSAGATVAELVDQTGWQPHTLRAALNRLRQRGFAVSLETQAGRKAYRCAGVAG